MTTDPLVIVKRWFSRFSTFMLIATACLLVFVLFNLPDDPPDSPGRFQWFEQLLGRTANAEDADVRFTPYLATCDRLGPDRADGAAAISAIQEEFSVDAADARVLWNGCVEYLDYEQK